jgi:tetratricopeptide (TPR) repeat protein
MSDMVLVDMGEKYEALSTQGSHPGVKKLSQEAVSLGNAGKTEQAIAKITEANKLLRKEIGTRQAQPLERAQLGFNEWLMATYLWNLHKADDAFSLINQAIKDDPMKSESYRFRAQIYEAQGKLDLAQADREKGKRIDESFLNGRDVAGSWSQTLRKEQEPMRHISR